MKMLCRTVCIAAAAAFVVSAAFLAGCGSEKNDTVVLRVSNWEEYIDLGDWDDDETIDVYNEFEDTDGIIGVNAVYRDFEDWFNSQDYGFDVKVEYSTFGTNEDLYNRLSLGDVYDLICPSDYMIMKLIDEGMVEEFSDDFFDTGIETNYYARYVSDYITETFDDVLADYGGRSCAACYMWGTTGIVYSNEVEPEDAATWGILMNEDYRKQVTVKDNVRDAYFAALAIVYRDELLAEGITPEERSRLLNATDPDTIAAAEDVLKDIKENVYSFETDSGKADMVTGKVVANFQWSGDAVYIMDEADDDDTELWYSVPDECTDLWFDGWIMLKDGIAGDENRKTAAEAFVNYVSRPDIAVRNMYYIGYTSAIAGQTVFDYMDWSYGLELDPDGDDFDEDVDRLYEYDLGYFFGDGVEDSVIYISLDEVELEDEDEATRRTETVAGKEYEIYAGGTINRGRQLFSQYPLENVMERSVVMLDFGDELGAINQMWINVRCLDLLDYDLLTVGIVAGVIVVVVAAVVIYALRFRIFRPVHRIGYRRADGSLKKSRKTSRVSYNGQT